MPNVEYTMRNIERCHCGKCPVYKSSECAKAKNATITDWTKLPPADVIEGIYCASAVGKSKCGDLNSKLACQCFSCPVYEECGLSEGYFCIRGSAG